MTIRQKIIKMLEADGPMSAATIIRQMGLHQSVGAIRREIQKGYMRNEIVRVSRGMYRARIATDDPPVLPELGSALILESRGFAGVDIDAVHKR